MYPRKGVVVAGADADIVVWDPNGRRTISAKTQFAKGGFNVFEGRTVRGIPSFTLAAGNVVFERGDLRAVVGAGRHVDRPAFTPTHA
jgi:dihydropyrimidinase